MARTRSLIPALPLPRRVLPWVLFVFGMASIAFGALTGEITGLGIGVVAVGGALLSWAAEILLRLEPPDANESTDEDADR